MKRKGDNVKIIGSSSNININLSYPLTKNNEDNLGPLEYMQTIRYKIPPNSFGQIEGDVDQFINDLQTDDALIKHKCLQDIFDENEAKNDRIKSINDNELINKKDKPSLIKIIEDDFIEYKNAKSVNIVLEEIRARRGVKSTALTLKNPIPEHIDDIQKSFINDVLNPNNNIITLLGKAGTG